MIDAAGAPARAAAYGAAAAVFAAYAIWGSLFPFDFQHAPIADVVALSDLWLAQRLSLTDLASNVLLFLPIGLFAAAFVETRARAASARAIAAVFACTVALSVAVEIGQAFVPARTPSILDVLAEAAGSALGISLWRIAGAELDDLLQLVVHRIARATRAERMLLAYVVLFAVWWWLPGDFTLRPGEIADKFEHKRLLLPFVPSPDAVPPASLVAIAGAAIPIGLAAALCGQPRGSRRSIAKAAGIATLFVVLLEAAQTLVFSRTTDAAGFAHFESGLGRVSRAAIAAPARRPAARVDARVGRARRRVDRRRCALRVVAAGDCARRRARASADDAVVARAVPHAAERGGDRARRRARRGRGPLRARARVAAVHPAAVARRARAGRRPLPRDRGGPPVARRRAADARDRRRRVRRVRRGAACAADRLGARSPHRVLLGC